MYNVINANSMNQIFLARFQINSPTQKYNDTRIFEIYIGDRHDRDNQLNIVNMIPTQSPLIIELLQPNRNNSQ
jgi:hypothetical protein